MEATVIVINDGKIDIVATDDGINAAQKVNGITPTVEINGGELTIDMGQGDTDAIDSNGNIYIGNIFHDTYIEVDEKGTKAGAATIVEMVEETAIEFEDKPEEVYLDRPFIYMIVDLELGVPVFIGTVKNL